MGILLCEQNFRDVWIRNKSVRAEIGQILRTHTQTHTHTTAAKLVVRITVFPGKFLQVGLQPNAVKKYLANCTHTATINVNIQPARLAGHFGVHELY